MTPQQIRISRFLSLILRHQPARVGVRLDAGGWIDVDTLLRALNNHGMQVSREDLGQIVAENDKRRFLLRDGRIRANQGHSIAVDLGLTPETPPDELFHGTAEKSMASIRRHGLLKRKRQHVHLSPDVQTALKVGRRHGTPVVLSVQAGAMVRDGRVFFLSENGVWLTDSVPPHYLGEFDTPQRR